MVIAKVNNQRQTKIQMEGTMTTTMTKTRTRTTDQINENQISKGMTIAMSAVPSLIGIWAAACFVGAMVTSGGPLELAKNYFQAIIGI